MAAPGGRDQRAHSSMPEISSLRALIFAKTSSFSMMAAPDGRARRDHSSIPEISYSELWFLRIIRRLG